MYLQFKEQLRELRKEMNRISTLMIEAEGEQLERLESKLEDLESEYEDIQLATQEMENDIESSLEEFNYE